MSTKANKSHGKPDSTETKPGLHPRNRHRTPYDFDLLVRACPKLGPFVGPNPYGGISIDFANPEAVKTLNQALLKAYYRMPHWDLPKGFLCPPIPGRADLIHYIADLLSGGDETRIPRGETVRVLDIGVGASLVYPIIGHNEYGWSFVGTETDTVALDWARNLIHSGRGLAGVLELRLQTNPVAIFRGILKPGERFAVTLCNPPFHASAEEASAATQRKLRNLSGSRLVREVHNFGGRANELWCNGGELGFLRRMIAESAASPDASQWFTSLVSRSENLPFLEEALCKAGVAEQRIIPMAQGQKKSRLLAWRFLPLQPQSTPICPTANTQRSTTPS